MKKYTLLLIAYCLLILSASAQIQQTIRGKILDNISQKPLSGASVTIQNTTMGTVANEDGSFRIEKVPVGRYSLKISFVGYQEVILSDILVNAGKEVVLDIKIEEKSTNLEEITVNVPKTELLTPTEKLLTVLQTKEYAATFFDPARLTTSFPGVATANDQANHIVVRGNSPNGLLWRLNGVDIVNPNHLTNAGTFSDRPVANGGGQSIFSAQVMDYARFWTGAFPAGYGNASAGAMDVYLRKGNNEKSEFTVQGGFIGVDLAAEGPLSSAKKSGSYLVNYRYSFTGLLALMGVNLGDEKIDFQDLSFNIALPAGKAGKFTVFGMGGLSNNVFEAKRDKNEWKYAKDRYDIAFSNKMGAFGVTHEVNLGNKTLWQSALAVSGKDSKRTADYLDDVYNKTRLEDDGLTQQKISFRTAFTTKFNNRHELNIGTLVNYQSDALYSVDASPVFSPQQIYSGEVSGVLFQPFVNYQASLSEKLTLNAGLHNVYYSYSQHYSPEPRASLQYRFTDKQNLSFSYGLHSQLQLAQTYLGKSGSQNNKNLDFSKAHHYVLTYNINLKEGFSVKAETYYQALFNIPVSATAQNSFSALNVFDDYVVGALANNGTGKNYGIELTARQFWKKGFYYLFTGSLYEAKYKGSDNIERDSRFNGKYLFSATGGKEFTKEKTNKNRVIGINARLIYQGGYRSTPIDEATSAVQQKTVFVENQAFSQKLQDYVRLDLRLSLKRNKPNYTRILSLDLQNALGTQNVAYQYYDPQQTKVVTKYQLGLLPVLNYRVEF
jgi:hypothetical protein